MMKSISYYNNDNQTDLTKGLVTIDGELESKDIKCIKFLCQDDIAFTVLEKIEDGIQIVNELERLCKIDCTKGNADYLVECLSRCNRMDLIRKLGRDHVKAVYRLELGVGHSNFSPFRILLFEIAVEMETTDLKPALFYLSTMIPRSKHERIVSVFDLFTQLERSGYLTPVKLDVLQKLLKILDRGDLNSKVMQYRQNYQGYVPTGWSTEPGYGPVDEGEVPPRVEIGMGPVDQGDPVDISDERQTATQRNQYQNSTVNNNRNKNDRQRAQISEQVKKKIKREDRASDRVLPGHQTEEQQHSSMQNLPSERLIGNQISDTVPFPRTGTSNNLHPPHSVPMNDVLEEEPYPGDSGLTVGTISLSDGSLQEMSGSSSGGEARILQGELGYMDHQGPSVPIRLTTACSDVQVGPSLNPLINQQPPTRSEEAIVRQKETAVIDDSIMPFYKMDAKPRGIAIIINNRYFHKITDDPNSNEMPERTGTEKDAEKLDYIWRKLGFIVRQHNDVDSTRMTQIMVETALNEDHTRFDCFVCCILTHGVLGHVYGTDGRFVRINQLTNCFSSIRCKTLAGKPKMFFIQACQGQNKQEGHDLETDTNVVTDAKGHPERQQDPSADRPRELIPDEADFLLGYATVPGYVSYRSRSQGSWYINKLSENLDKYAYQHDLLSILIKVNEEVGRATANIDNGSYKQVPAPMFTLRKRIIFR